MIHQIFMILIFVMSITFTACNNTQNDNQTSSLTKEEVKPENLTKAQINIEGMVCTGCEEHINGDIMKMEGIVSSTTSHEKGESVVVFDKSQTSIDDILSTVNNTGYKATGHTIVDAASH